MVTYSSAYSSQSFSYISFSLVPWQRLMSCHVISPLPDVFLLHFQRNSNPINVRRKILLISVNFARRYVVFEALAVDVILIRLAYVPFISFDVCLIHSSMISIKLQTARCSYSQTPKHLCVNPSTRRMHCRTPLQRLRRTSLPPRTSRRRRTRHPSTLCHRPWKCC